MGKKIKILLVDDTVDFLQTMAFWFKTKGYSVATVSNGTTALRMIRNSPPDIAFIDVLMPGLDGVVTVKMIREFNKTLPIVMMSAYEKGEAIRSKTKFYGIFDFFNKGEDFSKAEALLKAALGKNT